MRCNACVSWVLGIVKVMLLYTAMSKKCLMDLVIDHFMLGPFAFEFLLY